MDKHWDAVCVCGYKRYDHYRVSVAHGGMKPIPTPGGGCHGIHFVEAVPEPEAERCGWLVERASGNPEPDCFEDTITIGPCGDEVVPGARWMLCAYHCSAMEMDEREFEHLAEEHEGRAFS